MKTFDEVLEILKARIDRQMLEDYIAREWLHPVSQTTGWYFEDIDIARLELVCHLSQDINVNDEGMDLVLSLLDQLYGMRTHMRKLIRSIAQQSPQIQSEIITGTK